MCRIRSALVRASETIHDLIDKTEIISALSNKHSENDIYRQLPLLQLFTLGMPPDRGDSTFLLGILESGQSLDCVLGGARQSDLAI